MSRLANVKRGLIGTAFAMSLLASSANAAVTVNMGAITCRQYLEMPAEMSRHFSAWMLGWYSFQTRQTTVDLVAMQTQIGRIKDMCRFNSNTPLLQLLQQFIGR